MIQNLAGVHFGMMALFDSYIAFHARTRPTALAVVAVDGSVTFEKFDRDVDRAMVELVDIAISPLESVAVAVASPYLEWVLVLALARLGIATASSSDAGSALILGDGTHRPDDVTRLLDRSAIERIFSGTLHQPLPPVRPDGRGLARVLQSSGTTGERKRVGMSWEVIDAAIRNAPIAYGSPQGPWLAATGIETILGLVVTLASWASGNPAVLGMTGRLNPAYLDKLRPRLIALVPDQLKHLLDDLPQDIDLHPLRIISGGGPVPPALARRTRQLTTDLRSVYGASETGSIAVADLSLLERQAGAAGFILPMVRVEIVDEQNQSQPPGTLGRIRVSSDRVADHFIGESSEGERWFNTGDLGRMGPDGSLRIEGRVDDIMNIAGHKILPGWVEDAALSYEEVADAGAFAIADEQGLDRCWLALVVRPDFEEARLSQALADQLRWLTSIKLLKLDQLPRNAMGKVQRDQLRALASAAPSGA